MISGSVHGAPSANTSTLDGIGLGVVGRKIEEYAYLCPGLYPWVNPGPATHESGTSCSYKITIRLYNIDNM